MAPAVLIRQTWRHPDEPRYRKSKLTRRHLEAVATSKQRQIFDHNVTLRHRLFNRTQLCKARYVCIRYDMAILLVCLSVRQFRFVLKWLNKSLNRDISILDLKKELEYEKNCTSFVTIFTVGEIFGQSLGRHPPPPPPSWYTYIGLLLLLSDL